MEIVEESKESDQNGFIFDSLYLIQHKLAEGSFG